jgi:Asp-tRNA(Asn)/Glu-tRNA(Gln) amidotransferase A subunit family amidase
VISSLWKSNADGVNHPLIIDGICPMKIAGCARSATSIAQSVREGIDEPLDAAQAALRNISKLDHALRAWTFVAQGDKLAAPSPSARESLLAGVPLGVKDIIHVADMPTGCGSRTCSDLPQQYDASSVALLRAAGVVPIGKTVTAEFAYVTPGATRNPADPRHTPGGSSSGSAAAVAAGMVPVALGTQTGGSMIRPAAFCGVVGFKPTFGAVARDGMKVMCESLDVIGWYGANVTDVALVAQVLLPAGRRPSSKSLQAVRIAFLDGNPGHVLEPAAEAALDHARQAFISNDIRVQSVPAFAQAAELLEAHSVIMHYEFARSLLPVVSTHEPLLSRPLIHAVEKGLAMPASKYLDMKAFQTAQQLRWEANFGDADLILTSSALGPAPKGLESTGASAFNKAWSLLGWPCLHLPTAQTPGGLPLGVQIVGRPGKDVDLLSWAHAMHEIIDRRPTRA